MISDEQGRRRLAPAMASFRLLVLAFVRDYIQQWGVSPSQGEIVNGLKTTRTRVRDALRSLAAEGLLLRTPGTRGLALPSLREEAIRQLRELGWVIDEEAHHAALDPKTTLPGRPLVDYPEPGWDDREDDGRNGQQVA